MTDAATLHKTTLTLDSHIDIPWPHTPDPFGATNRHVDMFKMRDGGLDAGCFIAFLPQGPLTQPGYDQATARAFEMLKTIRGMGRREAGITAALCPTPDAILAAKAAGELAIIPAVENGYAIGLDLANIGKFRDLGVVYITLCHNGHNQICDSANPRRDLNDTETLHGGLSPFGREVVAEMNRVGIMVDVSHTSRATMLQAVTLSTVPVVASHSCATTLCPHPRNLDDSQLDALRDSGGVAQITAMPPFLRPRGRSDTVNVADYADHVDYVVKRAGLTHCGISSDFDGGGAIVGWRHAGESANLTEELVRRGYGAEELSLLWGGNFLRVMRTAQTAAEPGLSVAAQ